MIITLVLLDDNSFLIKFFLEAQVLLERMFLKISMRSLNKGQCLKFQVPCRYVYQQDNSIIHDTTPRSLLYQIKQTLKQKQIATIEGHACIMIECPICESEKSKKPKIYINKTTGKKQHFEK